MNLRLAITLTLASLLAACGGDSDGSSPEPTATTGAAAASSPVSMSSPAPSASPAAAAATTWTQDALCAIANLEDLSVILGAPVRQMNKEGNDQYPRCRYVGENNWNIVLEVVPPLRPNHATLERGQLLLAIKETLEGEGYKLEQRGGVGQGGVQLLERGGSTPAGSIFAVSGKQVISITPFGTTPAGIDPVQALGDFGFKVGSALDR